MFVDGNEIWNGNEETEKPTQKRRERNSSRNHRRSMHFSSSSSPSQMASHVSRLVLENSVIVDSFEPSVFFLDGHVGFYNIAHIDTRNSLLCFFCLFFFRSLFSKLEKKGRWADVSCLKTSFFFGWKLLFVAINTYTTDHAHTHTRKVLKGILLPYFYCRLKLFFLSFSNRWIASIIRVFDGGKNSILIV